MDLPQTSHSKSLHDGLHAFMFDVDLLLLNLLNTITRRPVFLFIPPNTRSLHG